MTGSASARLEVDLEGQCSRVGHDAAKQIAYGSEVVLAVGEHGLGQREPTELVVVRGSDGVIVGNGKIWRSSRLDHCHRCVSLSGIIPKRRARERLRRARQRANAGPNSSSHSARRNLVVRKICVPDKAIAKHESLKLLDTTGARYRSSLSLVDYLIGLQ